MKSEKGQSLVEFALLLPVLLLLIMGILDFGRIFHTYLSIDHAGREAARAVSVDGLNSTNHTTLARSVAKAASSVKLEDSNITVTPDAAGAISTGSNVTIHISYPIEFLTLNLLPESIVGEGTFPDVFPVTNTTVMRVE